MARGRSLLLLRGRTGPNVTSRIAAVAPDWAYAWGRGGQVVKVTHDGGAHWFASVLPPIHRIVSSGHTLQALLFGNSSEYVSRDYGLTWLLAEPEPLPMDGKPR